jgi:hypothetical protein
VTLKLKAAFISVDCYATPTGPVLGELTHTPGAPWYRNMFVFSDQFDQELGHAWKAANERLGAREAVLEVPYSVIQNGKAVRQIV